MASLYVSVLEQDVDVFGTMEVQKFCQLYELADDTEAIAYANTMLVGGGQAQNTKVRMYKLSAVPIADLHF